MMNENVQFLIYILIHSIVELMSTENLVYFSMHKMISFHFATQKLMNVIKTINSLIHITTTLLWTNYFDWI